MFNYTNTSANEPNTTRVASTFLIKPMYEGKAHRCYRSGFIATCEESRRVLRLEDMRLDGVDPTSEEYRSLKSQQPLFFLQETFSDTFPGYSWNGLLLYRIAGKEDARKVAVAHREELHIVLSFEDPDQDFYYILVDSGTGGGSREEFETWRHDICDMMLSPRFHNPMGMTLDHYSRAMTINHYDIVDYDVLFGAPQPVEGRSGCLQTIGEVLKSIVDKLHLKSA